MHQRYFFDTSFFIAIIKREPDWERCAELLQRLKRAQKFTSVLVAYELHRGTPSAAGRQSVVIDERSFRETYG